MEQLASGAGSYISSTSSTGGGITPTNVQDEYGILHFFALLARGSGSCSRLLCRFLTAPTRARARTRALGASGVCVIIFARPRK